MLRFTREFPEVVKIHPQSSVSYLLRLALIVALTLAVTCLRVAAQEKTTDGATPLGLAPGAPAGSYALSDFESVNLYNGNLNFHLPLVNIGGRGNVGYALTMRIDRKWTVEKQQDIPNRYEPIPRWWDLDEGEPILSVGKLQGRYGISRDFYNTNSCGYFPNKTLTRLTFTAPDGTEYELRDQSTNGEPHHPTCSFSIKNRGKIFVTADGTSATFVSDADISDFPYFTEPADLLPTGYLVLRDGTRYEIVGGKVMTMRDRNGNKVTFSYSGSALTSVTDSLNRVITLSYVTGSPTYTQISMKGFGGAPTRTIKIYRGTSMRSDFTARSYKSLFNNTLNNASDQNYYPVGVTAVELPNGQQYQFQYNDYGELARVALPTGGAIEYDYAPGLTDDSGGGVVSFTGEKHIYRRVVERRVYPDGGTGSSYANRTTYSRPESSSSNNGYVIERQYSSTALLARTDHYFNGSPRTSLHQQPTEYSGWQDGREYQTKLFDANETTLLRQLDRTFQQREAVSWWTGSSAQEPPSDTRLVETVTILSDTNQVTKQTSINPNDSSDKGYDQYNNQTDVWEFDYGSGSPGSLLRHTHTSYVTSTTYTDVDDGPYLLSLPSQVSIYNASGVERSRTTFEYDVYTGTYRHELIPRSDITGLCDGSSTNCPTGPDFTNVNYLTRGNVTATTRYFLNSSGTATVSITVYAQYDVAGNVVKSIDARGYETTFAFNDCFGGPNGDATTNSGASELGNLHSYAFATSVTNALSQTVYAQYDFYTGRAVDAQDANGIISSGYSDNDPLDRPTKVIKGVNGGSSVKSQTVFSYDDTNRIVTVTSDFDGFEDTTPLKSQTVYDGLGRVSEKRQYENSTDFIAVRQSYDVLGPSSQTSNPFRAGEAVKWTVTDYDALGRVKTVTTPDSALVTTTYSGNSVTVSDQTGRKRQSVTDGLGRLVKVYEAPNESSYNYLTSYEYDALNNLTEVTQGTQSPREFGYDSLKRLTSATNPENGTVSYQYDNNGNLEVKADARGVSAHYAYDELNRVIRRWYNGSTSTSYTTNNSPSLPSGVGASDEVKFFYDSQEISGAPTFDRGYAIGRLVATTYGGGSTGDYYGYDAGGRTVLKIQRTGSVNYQTTATYNPGGALLTEYYPSQRTVTNTYDSTGRTASVMGYLGDNNQRTYATGITYSPFGGMTQEQFGTTTAIYNKLLYNSRGQLSEIRASTSGNDTTSNRGQITNDYSLQCSGASCDATDNNGNLRKQTVYVPNNDQNTNPVSWYQQYDYDPLNRLTEVHEYTPNTSLIWQQIFTYDRWGNRTINHDNTSPSIPRLEYAASAVSNKLYASGETDASHTLIDYDAAGNQKKDYYSDSATSGASYDRIYDAENRMTESVATFSWGSQTTNYVYDGDGRRIKRIIGGTETWQVYGIGGELIAEYAANASYSSPRKEYGYRNGQLLITAGSETMSAAPPTGLGATSNSGNVTLSWTGSGAAKYRVERKVAGGSFVLFDTTTSTSITDNTAANGSAYLYKVCSANNAGSCTSDYGNIVMGARFYFPTDATICASSDSPPCSELTSVKHEHINELRDSINAVRALAGDSAAWVGQSVHAGDTIYKDDVQELRTKLDESLQHLNIQTSIYEDNTLAGAPNGTLIKAVHIRQLRQRATSGSGNSGSGGSSATFSVHWLVADQLGTPRIILDQSGLLANTTRHDYLPFGEELADTVGLRSGLGFTNADGARQKFTQKERDNETGLDCFGERYYASTQGRFVSVDPLGASAIVSNPQSFNRYTYVLNNPLKYVDPDGLDAKNPWADLNDKERELLAPKLTAVTGKNQMAAAQEAFNKLVTTGTKSDQQIANNVASVQNFVGSLGGDKNVWSQITSIDNVGITGDGKQSNIAFSVQNRDAFTNALTETKDAYGYNRFVYMGPIDAMLKHPNGIRELGFGVTDPSMHMDSQGSGHLSAHWDPSSSLTKDTWKEAILDTVPGGVVRRVGAGVYHYTGKATTQAVRQYLKDQGLVPQH